MSKTVRKRCPLLELYYIPLDALGYGRSKGNRSDFVNRICWEFCPPKVYVCVFDRSGRVHKFDREELLKIVVPCPHCGAKDHWQEKTEDGCGCIHCGVRAYAYDSLPKTRGRVR